MKFTKRLLTLYYAACAFLMCAQWIIPRQLADPDLWGRLSVAALWFENGAFPYRDVFSFTAFHHRWIDHEWLSGVLFYLPLWLSGEIGLHLLKYGIIVAIFYLLFSQCRRTVHDLTLLMLNGILAGLYLFLPLYGEAMLPTIRAQIFSFLFFVAFLWVLERVRQAQEDDPTAAPANHRMLWWLVPLGVIWANAHGGFILGLILLALYGAGVWLGTGKFHLAKQYGIVAIVLVAAIAVLNPYGLDYWPFILHALTMPRPFIGEWSPLPLLTLDYWFLKLIMLLVAGTFVLLLRKSSNAQNRSALFCSMLVLLFLTGLAVKGLRFKAFYILGVLFYLPLFMAWRLKIPPFPRETLEKLGLYRLSTSFSIAAPPLMAATGLAMVLMLYSPHYYARTIVQTGEYAKARGLFPFPVEMMQYLKNSPYQGNLINPFSWGEFLAWTLYPSFKVAWDGRYEEVYQKPEMDFFTEFYALPHQYNPQRIRGMADRSAGDFILIESISPNQPLVAQNPAWRLLASDGFYFLYGRESSLQQLPPYHPAPALAPLAQTENSTTTSPVSPTPPRIYTIGDFFQPADLRRFRSP